ncbi:MAG: TlpA disulfide reductase family protein [Clostridia bacterium]
MKKWMSILLAAVCLFSFAGCQKEEIGVTIKPFPAFKSVDFEGNAIDNDVFKDYDATIVNVWSNGCGSCIEEMPELEAYYQQFKDKDVHLMGIAVSACDSQQERAQSAAILEKKGVTYPNLILDPESDFYRDFIGDIAGFPATYVVDRNGNMVGAPITGVVKPQEDRLIKRIEQAQAQN